jgi:hypothetical protein
MSDHKLENLINPEEYDVVICISGRVGRLFEYGNETTSNVKEIELLHGAGRYAELTVKRHIREKRMEGSRGGSEQLDNIG